MKGKGGRGRSETKRGDRSLYYGMKCSLHEDLPLFQMKRWLLVKLQRSSSWTGHKNAQRHCSMVSIWKDKTLGHFLRYHPAALCTAGVFLHNLGESIFLLHSNTGQEVQFTLCHQLLNYLQSTLKHLLFKVTDISNQANYPVSGFYLLKLSRFCTQQMMYLCG